jgi:hypothetical protein
MVVVLIFGGQIRDTIYRLIKEKDRAETLPFKHDYDHLFLHGKKT